MSKNTRALICLICVCCLATACTFNNLEGVAVSNFVNKMAAKHHFAHDDLKSLFNQVDIKDDILIKIAKPSETLPWYKYRRIFLKKPRIDAGLEFWRSHRAALDEVEQRTGVPAQIIVAIIGVETFYGKHTGNYRIIDALATLGFNYPPRSAFFLSELENFLLLCRDGNIDPLKPQGSYAGAMGIPQFMPSSYLKYAVDFNKDSQIDIWHDPEDAIASVGNYFARHGWKKNQPIAHKIGEIDQKTGKHSEFIKDDLRNLTFNSNNPNISTPLLSTKKAKIIAFEQENGEELWALSDNFYVITKYNHSLLYALAVYQLSLALSNQFSQSSFSSSYEKNYPPPYFPFAGRLFQPSG